MCRVRLLVPPALAILFLASPALACLWDYDTLQQERSRFPDALELITGKFLRHSPEFYEWRIRDRYQKLQSDPDNLATMDDLAVAYDKTGRHQEAIDLMTAADRNSPGRYETEANLGTFYIHAGQFEKGLEHIDRALRINPDAHFGREKYQKLLVEYALSRRQGGATPLPLRKIDKVSDEDYGNLERANNFVTFLAEKSLRDGVSAEGRAAALKGLLGIMRFGKHDSPVLLEAIGDVLGSPENRDDDAKQLAARAYLKASYEVTDEAAQKVYRAMARSKLKTQMSDRPSADGMRLQLSLDELEGQFRQELAEADTWYGAVRRDELTWIEQGRDPEQEFTRKYYQEPQVVNVEQGPGLRVVLESRLRAFLDFYPLAAWVIFMSVLALALLLARYFRLRYARAGR